MQTARRMTEPSAARDEKALIVATKAFAVDDRRRSWIAVTSTFALLALATGVALGAWPAPVRLAASTLEALLVVRAFVLFHDFMHRAILRGSRLARALFWIFGLTILTPPTVWRETHDYHHAHTAKLVGSHIGSFPTVSVPMWEAMSARDRRRYRLARHPLTIAGAYLTVFALGMCVGPLRRDARRHRDAAIALVVHLGLVAALVAWRGPEAALLGYVGPLVVAMATGAYLFYAQHNFPGVVIAPRQRWTYASAALRSSSFLAMGPVGRYFTGNIGFHHVHHLNAAIPFYRLPDAMRAFPELGAPTVTSLRPADIAACLRLKVWDPVAGRLVPFP